MNPIFFGSSKEALFGVYHPPHSDSGRKTGVVLCYPLGQEYMRAHRAFRQLALLLSRAGFPVLRFDYYGTGDSAGLGEDATVERWIEDIGTAIEELQDTADVDAVAVVGLRLGGTLGAYAAAGREDVSHLILWDAVVNGQRYVDQELTQHAREGIGAESAPSGQTERRQTPARGTAGGVMGVMGFPLSAALLRSLSGLNLAELAADSDAERFVVVSGETPEQQSLSSGLKLAGRKGRFLCVPSEGNWNEVDDFGSALIPQAIIRAIVDHLSDRAA